MADGSNFITLSVTGATSTTLSYTCSWNITSSDVTPYAITWYINNTEFKSRELPSSSTYDTCTFTGLSPSTTYSVYCTLTVIITNTGMIDYDSATSRMKTDSSSGGGPGDITVIDYTLLNIETSQNVTMSLGSYSVGRIKMTFSYSGTARFQSYLATSGTWACLSTSANYDSYNGIPNSRLTTSYDATGDFDQIEYDVTAGTTYYLYVCPFTNGDSLDCQIIIWPPEKIATSWTVAHTKTISSITEENCTHISLESGEVYRFKVSFSTAGPITFFSQGNYDTIAYLSDSTSFDVDSGEPYSILEWADGGGNGDNFSFTYDVTANTYYYLFVRLYHLTDRSDTFDVYMQPSRTWAVRSQAFDDSGKTSLNIKAGYVYRYAIGFSNDGTATFYTTGSEVDTYGYLSTSTDFDAENGCPVHILAENDDVSTNDRNFRIVQTVEKNVTYYLFVRAYSNGTSGSVVVCVDFQAEETPDPAGSAVLTSVSTTVRSVTLKVTGLDTNYSKSDRVIRWYYGLTEYNATKYGESNLSAGVSESDEYIITGLDANTPYYFYAIIIFGDSSKQLETITVTTDAWHSWNYGDLGTLTTEKSQAMNLGMGEVGYVTVAFQYSGTATFYTSGYTDTIGVISESYSFNRTIGWPNTYIGSPVDDGIGDSYSNFKFTQDVTAGITYYVWVRYYFGNLSCNTTLYIDPPKKQLNKPTAFSWDTPKIQGQTFHITAVEWNKLQTKVNEAREYQADKTGSSIPTYGFTAVSSGQSFTAEAYNAVLMGIAGALSILGSSGIYDANEVHTGDLVTAAKINRLVTLVNELIDT